MYIHCYDLIWVHNHSWEKDSSLREVTDMSAYHLHNALQLWVVKTRGFLYNKHPALGRVTIEGRTL